MAWCFYTTLIAKSLVFFFYNWNQYTWVGIEKLAIRKDTMSHIICHLRIPKDSDAKVTTFIKVQLKYHKLHLIHAMNQHLFVNLPSFAGITVIQFQNMFLSSPQDPSCPLIPIPYPKSPPISFLYTRNISLESSSVLSWKLPCVCIHRNKYRCDLETYGYYTSHAFRKLLQLQDAKLDNTWGKFCDKSHSSSHSSLRINCPEYKTEHWHLLQWIPVTLKSIRQTCSTWSPSWPAGPQHSNSFHLWWSRWVKRHYGQKQIEKEPNGQWLSKCEKKKKKIKHHQHMTMPYQCSQTAFWCANTQRRPSQKGTASTSLLRASTDPHCGTGCGLSMYQHE